MGSLTQATNIWADAFEEQAKRLRQQKEDKREEEKLSFSRFDHEQKVKQAKHMDDYSSRMEEIDPTAAAALRSGRGADVDSILKINHENLEKDKFKKTFNEFSLTTSMIQSTHEELGKMNKEIQQALAAGDKEKAAELKEQFVA